MLTHSSNLWLLHLKAVQAESEKKTESEKDSFKAAWAQKPERYGTKFERTLWANSCRKN